MLEIVKMARDVLGGVIPPESDPFDFIDAEEGPLREEFHTARKANRKWRNWVAVYIIGLVVLVLAVAFTPGMVVFAGDVDKKISKAVEPIQQEIKEIKAMITAQTTSNNNLAHAVHEQMAQREADNICRLLNKRSKEPDIDEKQRLRNDIDTAQARYKIYKLEYYPESRCAE